MTIIDRKQGALTCAKQLGLHTKQDQLTLLVHMLSPSVSSGTRSHCMFSFQCWIVIIIVLRSFYSLSLKTSNVLKTDALGVWAWLKCLSCFDFYLNTNISVFRRLIAHYTDSALRNHQSIKKYFNWTCMFVC